MGKRAGVSADNAALQEARAAALNALRGIASCATSCGCCEMHQRIARSAVSEIEAAQRREATQ
jgi:hypothetical protein